MIAVACLIVFVALLGFMLRGSSGPLAPAERLYLFATPLPFILAIILPGPIALIGQGSSGVRTWGLWLNSAGGWLSMGLVLTGILLAGRRWTRGEPRNPRLTAGLLLAAIPAVLMGAVALMYQL